MIDLCNATDLCGTERISNMETQTCKLYRPPDATRDKPSCAAAEILSELHNLLQNYAPQWYTAEHHKALQAAIDKMDHLGS
jgi:hypothetical protein